MARIQNTDSGMGVEKQEVSFQMGMQSDLASVEHSLAASHKMKEALTRIQQARSSTLAQKSGKHPHDVDMALIHVNIDTSLFHNCLSFNQLRCPLIGKCETEEHPIFWGLELKTSS